MQKARREAQSSDHNQARVQKFPTNIDDLWARMAEPSPEVLKHITQFVVQLPEPYKQQGLRTVAEHLVNLIILRYLEIMATFKEKAEAEGLDQAEQESALDDILPVDFQKILAFSEQVSIQSFEDLAKILLTNLGLYRPSQTLSAESAQDWLYSFAGMYSDRLEQSHLIPATESLKIINTIDKIKDQGTTAQ